MLLVGVGLLFNLAMALLPRASYDAVVVHHSASPVGDLHSIRRAHHARGWFEIAYHLVLSNGSTAVPFGHLYPTRRYRLGLWSVATRSPRFNLSAVHLCVVGNFEDAPAPSVLGQAVGHALAQIQSRHRIPDERIYLHRDCSATACPGRFVDQSRLLAWKGWAGQVDAGVRAQHRRALDLPRLGPLAYGLLWALGNLGLGHGVWKLLGLRRRERS